MFEKFRFNLNNLPEALKAELKIVEAERNVKLLLKSVEDLDGQASVDEVIVQLWKITNKIFNRSYVANKLYRMVKEGYLVNVPKAKGIYALNKTNKR